MSAPIRRMSAPIQAHVDGLRELLDLMVQLLGQRPARGAVKALLTTRGSRCARWRPRSTQSSWPHTGAPPETTNPPPARKLRADRFLVSYDAAIATTIGTQPLTAANVIRRG